MQCTGNSGCFPRGKASSHSTALPSYVFHLCSVSIPPAVRPAFVLFTADEYGIFDVRTHLGARHTYEGGIRHKQICTRVNSQGQKNFHLNLPHQRIEPRVFDSNSDSLTTELRVPRHSKIMKWRTQCLSFTSQPVDHISPSDFELRPLLWQRVIWYVHRRLHNILSHQLWSNEKNKAVYVIQCTRENCGFFLVNTSSLS